MKRISLLGSTGSIGTSTLDVVARFPERFSVVALAAGENTARLAEQIRRFAPGIAVVIDEKRARELRTLLPADTKVEILHGPEGYRAAAAIAGADMVVSAMVGAAGLEPTIAAVEAGKTVALANKEVLVMAADVVMPLAAEKGVSILPVDSEHSAIFQCLAGQDRQSIDRIHLTASGGPFLNKSRAEMAAAGPEAALSHPTWEMGKKISIDSATLMNKGLEVIEAAALFGVTAAEIEVIIHPQSIVHSLVSYVDGSMLAQLGVPDMRGAIAYALSYPERLSPVLPAPDLADLGTLSFEKPDLERFPCLGLAYEAARRGGTCPAVLNAANEAAVMAFLEKRISFFEIPAVIEGVLADHRPVTSPGLADIQAADAWARQAAAGKITG
ncbi:MAG: 1-deoxy-D-xylulose-5-phosphate reductoisomerase [Desulfosudaceae bacterium]